MINLTDLSAASPYLASDDYAVGTLLPIVEIERIQMADVPIPNSAKKSSKCVLYFKGAVKGYVINKNVARKVAAVIGQTKNIDKTWIGARIQLEVVGDVRRPDGTKGNAFRLAKAWPPNATPDAPATPAEVTP